MNELQRLRPGFERGLCTRDDVSAWVDREVERLEVLPSELLELTTMAHLDDVAVGHLLRALGGTASVTEEAQYELTVVAALFRRGSLTLGQAIDHLYGLGTRALALSEAQRQELLRLECAYALAVEGVAGTLHDVRRELEDFLAGY